MNNWAGLGDNLNDEASNYLWHPTAHFQENLIDLKQKKIIGLSATCEFRREKEYRKSIGKKIPKLSLGF